MTEPTQRPRKKLLVTGWSGFVAGSVIAQAQCDWQVHGVGRTQPLANTPNAKYHRMDLLEEAKVEKLFREISPDAVIHAAAIADIDFCQSNQEIAEKSNVRTVDTLNRLCLEMGSKFVFCSTDNVFDGENGSYSETDAPKAINFYAETKVRAEKIIQESETKSVIARLALVIGLPVIGRGNSFLSGAIEKWKKGRSAGYPDNETRTPIDVITLGKALIELAGNDLFGIVHLAGNSCLTRYEMARKIAEKLNCDPGLNYAVNSNEIDGRAPRPENASLDNSKARRLLNTPMLSLLDGLDSTLNYRAPQGIGRLMMGTP